MLPPINITTVQTKTNLIACHRITFSPFAPSSPLAPMMRNTAARRMRLTQSCTNLAEGIGGELHCNNRRRDESEPSCSHDDDEANVCSPGSPPLADLLLGLCAVQHEYKFASNGYRIVRKMMDSLQGELYECVIIDAAKREKAGMSRVVIKQVSKNLHRSGEAEKDGAIVLVEENVIKEAMILKHLTKDNSAYGGYIAKYIDFFETDKEFFLVMEYAGEITLAQWIQQAFELLNNGKLKLAEYKKAVKFMFWQICVTVHWMHHDMNVCHLDLSVDNIVVDQGDFELDEADGCYHVSSNIAAKIVDFGLAEKFCPGSNSQKVAKWGLKDSYSYTEPNMYAEFAFDGMKADIWSLGMILFQLSCGQRLCVLPAEDEDLGFRALCNGKIMDFLRTHRLKKYFSKKVLRLVGNMLDIDEQQRLSAQQVLKCEWFAGYYQRYGPRICKKSRLQKARNLQQRWMMADFPYYRF
mmetsp:Transcript_17564/g.28052  ORF Transcript_17564/g.28052 Transcript_17564/m.28052 type:complete len:467 (+) Transcript_17564:120-1520(+)